MKWQLTLELVNILKVFTGFYEYSGIVLGNALQGLIKGDVHYAKQSHSGASQASMSTVLSHVKKEKKTIEQGSPQTALWFYSTLDQVALLRR